MIEFVAIIVFIGCPISLAIFWFAFDPEDTSGIESSK